jgi:hypothetical protein
MKNIKRQILALSAFLIAFSVEIKADTIPPSHFFALTGWKLQIPGPAEIKSLAGYSSHYFYLAADTSVCFSLDASEKVIRPIRNMCVLNYGIC